MTARRWTWTMLLSLALVFVLVRGPLHLTTFRLPVSNDDAILLLMARYVLKGELATILWNQPYNGALDAYLLAPGLLVAGPHTVFRLYELTCALLLVLLAGLVARRLGGPVAGWAAALLAAWGTPYMALMTCTGPPPNFLMPLVTGFPLLAALGRLDPQAPPLRPIATFGLGLVCGLAVWNSSLAIPAFAGMAAGLALAGLRPGRSAVALLAGLALGASPLVVAHLIGASGAKVVTASSAVTALRPLWLWPAGLGAFGQAVVGLVGVEVPLVVDGGPRAALPLALSLALAVAFVALVLVGGWSRRALPLLGWAGALGAAFVLSRRTGPDDLRYLYGLNPPLIALAGVGLARAWARRRAVAVAVGAMVLIPWAAGERALVETWRDPGHAVRVWEVPSIAPALGALDRLGIESAYASLQFAGRLTLDSGGRVITSQAWNERIPGDPLRFRDEVDLDSAPAWVLSPHLSRGMTRSAGFREMMRRIGGSYHEEAAGDLVVFHGFRPPYDESRPVPAAEISVAAFGGGELPPSVRDRDVATAWTSPYGITRGSGLAVRPRTARRLSALVLGVDLERSPLAVPWVCEREGPQGTSIVARGPERQGFQWVNGAPRAAKQALLAVSLGGEPAREVRLIFQGAGSSLVVSEVFLYGPDEAEWPRAGAAAAAEALRAARSGDWVGAARLYGEAARLEPERADYHAALLRARWRAAHRRWLDVESLDDGGPELVLPR